MVTSSIPSGLAIIKAPNVKAGAPMKVSAQHDKLIALAQRRFDGFTPYQVVTFLNQSLKEKGLIFGLRQFEDEWELTVYDAHNQNGTP